MKAIQIHEFGTPDVLCYEDIEQPEPAAHEILIRVESASVNYSDVMRRRNAIYPFPTSLPFIPGSEVAGTVAALGSDVTGPAIGTPVFALVGTGSNGYAQYVVTPAQQVVPVPKGLDADRAAALPVAGTTAMLMLREIANIQPGETVLIQGAAGGVGLYAIQLAKVLGAGKVIGAASLAAKCEAVMKAGADDVVDYTAQDWFTHVQALTDGRGVDVILEMQGGEGFNNVLRCLAPFGRVVVYGMASGQPLSISPETILEFFYDPSLNQSIHVFNLGLWFGLRPELAGKAMGDLIGFVAAGQVDVNIGTVLPLSEAREAHRRIESRQHTGKIILKPWLN